MGSLAKYGALTPYERPDQNDPGDQLCQACAHMFLAIITTTHFGHVDSIIFHKGRGIVSRVTIKPFNKNNELKILPDTLGKPEKSLHSGGGGDFPQHVCLDTFYDNCSDLHFEIWRIL